MTQKESESPPESSKNSLRTFWIFCAVVVAIILVSLCFRIVLLVKNSKFDGSSGFVMMVLQNNNKKATIYSFDPSEGTVSRVYLESKNKLPNIAQTLSIPIEGQIRKSKIEDSASFPLEISSPSLYSQSQKNDISIIDAIRLWYHSHAISEYKQQSIRLTLPNKVDTIETELGEFFIDSRLEKDKKSITVINGTSVSGLGGRLEHMISRIGGSVISITTSHASLPTSKIIYFGEKNYTVERLTNILPYQVEQREGNSLSDIIIEIGEDSQRTTLY